MGDIGEEIEFVELEPVGEPAAEPAAPAPAPEPAAEPAPPDLMPA